jgi:hypothetical protein
MLKKSGQQVNMIYLATCKSLHYIGANCGKAYFSSLLVLSHGMLESTADDRNGLPVQTVALSYNEV